MSSSPTPIHPEYSFLASYYDEVMKDVDYEAWAEFLDDLIQLHHPIATHVHEVSCGTGSILLELDRFGTYVLSGSDKSEHMIERAKLKNDSYHSDLHFFQDDYLMLSNSGPYDVVLSVFDSMNYILELDGFYKMFKSIQRILDKHGIFIFDFTTPAHSVASLEWLDNEKTYSDSGVRILRRSQFDSNSNLHSNHFSVFSLKHSDPIPIGQETHLQRAYTYSEIKQTVANAGWEMIAAYGDFEFTEADSESHRVCVICRPKT